MAMGPRLELRQSQSLVMTPQLQQAIRLLALSNLELEAVVAEEVEKNPLLESGEERITVGTDRETDGEATPDPASADELIGAGKSESDAPLDAVELRRGPIDAPVQSVCNADAKRIVRVKRALTILQQRIARQKATVAAGQGEVASLMAQAREETFEVAWQH